MGIILILLILFGVVIVVSGVNGLRKGELKLSRKKPVHGTPATIGNLVVLAIGLAIVGYALFGIGI